MHFILRGRLVFAAAAMLIFVDHAFAQNTIEGSKVFGWLQPYVETAVSAVILFGLGWGAMILKTKFNLDIDAQQRDALHTFLARQAASLVADGFVKVDGLKINVESSALANAANSAGTFIPGVLAHFDITPDKLEKMIVDKLPAVPSVAATAAAQAAPPAAAPGSA